MKKKTPEHGLDPATLPPIFYCRKHEHYINLHPTCIYGMMQGYRVVCPDCGVFGPWEKTPAEAITSWNAKYGICLTPTE